MVGWYHRLDEYEFGQALGFGVEQEAWCSAVYGRRKELDTIELN